MKSIQNLENELIYPNPSNGKFNLRLTPDYTIHRLVVLNILGKVVQEDDFFGNKSDYQIDLSSQAAGIYYIKLYSGNNITTQKAVVY
ncbi:MAG: T9SS type A sorting domain-containing protein [Bacteroidetes bacterium]|nr:T9SS type A sorting domain-containing protein [Bacteroidota bacterium]